MAELELLSPDGEDIRFALPDGAPAAYALAGTNAFGAATSFGDFYFYHYAGGGLSI